MNDADDSNLIDEGAARPGGDRPGTNTSLQRRFDGVELAANNAASQALVAKATADVQARWVMALKNPRDIDRARQVMLRNCRNPEFAKAAIYSLPRGGKQIRGLTIRFAEEVVSAMGNLLMEAQTLIDTDEGRVIRVTVTDLESNGTWMRDITVPKTTITKDLRRGQRPLRTRTNSFGEMTYVVDADDLQVQ